MAVFGPGLVGTQRRYLFYTRGIIALTALALAGNQAIDEIGHAQKIRGPEATPALGRSLE
jgi:hypothetical protein